MRAFVFAFALLAAVTWTRPVSAAAVAVDVVKEQQALEIGERDVWGLWLRTTDDVQVEGFAIFANMRGLESIEFDVTNPDLSLDISSIGPDVLGDSIPLLIAYGHFPSPLVGPSASGRIATLTGLPIEFPPHVFTFPELIPFENTIYSAPWLEVSNASGSPLEILSLSGPFPPFPCQVETCEIPVAPNTGIRWLWAAPEPGAGAPVAVALALLALRRRA